MKKIIQFVSNSSSSIALTLMLIVSVVLPLLTLPIGDNILVDGKVLLFFALVLIITMLWLVNSFIKKSLQVTLSPFLAPLVFFGGISIVSSFNTTQFPTHHLLGVGGVYVGIVALTIFASSLIKKRSSQLFLSALLIPAVMLSLASLAELANFGPSFALGNILKTTFPHSPVFSLAGTALFAAQFLFAVLAGVGALIWTKKSKQVIALYFLPALIVAAGLIVNVQTILQLQKTSSQFLPYAASYLIATDTLKSAKSAVIGVGPEYFLHSYLQYKPAWMNNTELWATGFTQGSSFPFTLLITMGVVGLIAWLLLAFTGVRQLFKAGSDSFPVAVVFCACILIQFLLPVNILIFALQATALAFWIIAEKGKLKDIQLHAFTVDVFESGKELQKVPKHSHVIVNATALIGTVIVLVCAYWIGKSGIAQYFTFRANFANAQNQWLESYQFQQKAVQFNSFSDTYRRKYALTNMAIAAALSSSKDLPDEEKQKIPVLIQQAIREANTATMLDPLNNANWLTLASIYSNLIGSVEGADGWTASAYAKAIEASPMDPTSYLELGGLFFQAKKYDQASQYFEKATMLKPDWPNASYNLANSYKQQEKFAQSIAAYQQTLAILSTTQGSAEDIKKITSELEEVQKLASESAKMPGKSMVPSTPKSTEVKAGSASLLAPTATGSAISPSAKKALEKIQVDQPAN